MKDELEMWVALEPGRAVRVRMSVVTEGLPSPNEQDQVRAPFLDEILQAARRLAEERIVLVAPF